MSLLACICQSLCIDTPFAIVPFCNLLHLHVNPFLCDFAVRMFLKKVKADLQAKPVLVPALYWLWLIIIQYTSICAMIPLSRQHTVISPTFGTVICLSFCMATGASADSVYLQCVHVMSIPQACCMLAHWLSAVTWSNYSSPPKKHEWQ